MEVRYKESVNNEELEQYRRRFCIWVDGVTAVNNESSDDVLKSMKSLFGETKVNIPEAVVDRVHRTGLNYLHKSSKKKKKKITKASL